MEHQFWDLLWVEQHLEIQEWQWVLPWWEQQWWDLLWLEKHLEMQA